jgi:hypothetical protein
MKAKMRMAALALATVMALAGCLDTSVKVIVKPDGSGTIEKTIVVSKTLVEFMKSMGSEGDSAAVEQSLLDEKSLKAQATGMGSGVTFLSAVKVSTDKGNGYKATYSFKDITKVKIDQNPSGDLNLPMGGAGQAEQAPQENITFAFARGSPAVLSIVLPRPTKEDTAKAKAKVSQAPQGGAEAQQMMEALKPLYENLRIAVSVEVQGRIVETNAANVKGSAITLVDIDFGKVLSDDAMFKKLSSGQQSTLGDTMALLKNVPGVVFEPAETVKVKFQ